MDTVGLSGVKNDRSEVDRKRRTLCLEDSHLNRAEDREQQWLDLLVLVFLKYVVWVSKLTFKGQIMNT